jgi:hypothetical protein
VAPHDGSVGHAQRAGGADVLEVARAQELGADEPHERGPAEEHDEPDEEPEGPPQDREHDDDDVGGRDARPDLDHALEDEVGPAAEVALHGAGRDADDGRERRDDEGEEDGQAEAVDDARQHVALGVVRAEPVVGVGRRRRHPGDVHDGVVRVGDGRPEHPALVEGGSSMVPARAAAIISSGS